LRRRIGAPELRLSMFQRSTGVNGNQIRSEQKTIERAREGISSYIYIYIYIYAAYVSAYTWRQDVFFDTYIYIYIYAAYVLAYIFLARCLLDVLAWKGRPGLEGPAWLGRAGPGSALSSTGVHRRRSGCVGNGCLSVPPCFPSRHTSVAYIQRKAAVCSIYIYIYICGARLGVRLA
jgi:hypothetical protein